MARPALGYRNKNDKKVPGSTTILKQVSAGMDSDILCSWSAKLARAGQDWRAVRDAAGKHGTVLHDLCEHHLPTPFDHAWAELKGLPDEQVAKLQASYTAIVIWWATWSPKVIAAEEALVSEEFQFGGTFDVLVELGGKPWLLDYKTGSQVGVKECAQMASYRQLIRETKGIEVQGATLIHAPTKHPGTMRPVRLDAGLLDQGWRVFEHALQLANVTRAIAKEME